jgi:hypothetical protein
MLPTASPHGQPLRPNLAETRHDAHNRFSELLAQERTGHVSLWFVLSGLGVGRAQAGIRSAAAGAAEGLDGT